MDDFLDDRTFCQAAAAVLGLPSDKLMLGVKLEPENGAMVLRASFVLAPGDVERIGQRAKEIAGSEPFYPPVPYEHFWMRKGGIPSRFMYGKDLVFWGDEVAYPWADMQETARVGRTPQPATLPKNNTPT